VHRVALTLLLLSCSRTELDGALDAGDAAVLEGGPHPSDATSETTSVLDAGGDVLAFPDAPLAQACRDFSRVIHIETDGGFSMDAGSATITGDAGTWSSMFVEASYFVVRSDSDADTPWAVAGGSDFVHGEFLDAGTYTSSGDPHVGWWIEVYADGHGCSAVPTGTFTIYEIASKVDDGPLSKLLVTFELECHGEGSLVGCARYEE